MFDKISVAVGQTSSESFMNANYDKSKDPPEKVCEILISQ